MAKNRTMAAKNAKVVKFAIEAGKTAMLAEAWNMPKVQDVSGLDLYSSHSQYMDERRKRLNVGKWCAKKNA